LDSKLLWEFADNGSNFLCNWFIFLFGGEENVGERMKLFWRNFVGVLLRAKVTLSKRRNVGDVTGDRGSRGKVGKIAGGEIEAGKSRGVI
jgi:hypothetical protein